MTKRIFLAAALWAGALVAAPAAAFAAPAAAGPAGMTAPVELVQYYPDYDPPRRYDYDYDPGYYSPPRYQQRTYEREYRPRNRRYQRQNSTSCGRGYRYSEYYGRCISYSRSVPQYDEGY